MVYRTRIKYTAEQKAAIWDRWQRGESLTAIDRLFRLSSKVRCFVGTPAGLAIVSTTRAGRYRVEHLSGWVAICGQVVCTLIGAQRSAGA